MDMFKKEKACRNQEEFPICTKNDIKKVALVSCSNGLPEQIRPQIQGLCKALRGQGMDPILSPYLYAQDSVAAGTASQRADILMQYYRDPEITAIFDVSGGDVANEILPYLDYEVIAASDKVFWGYSDLTTVINAIYARTGKSSVLYQARNLVGSHAEAQTTAFRSHLQNENQEIFAFPYHFVQGDQLQGTVVGGNIRCLLKLAGTPYWPDMKEKVLLLEARSGGVAQMTTYLSQLNQMGVFGQVKGVLLGTFTAMEREQESPTIEELVKRFAGDVIPIAKTDRIGHGGDSKAIWIGREIFFEKVNKSLKNFGDLS